MDQTWQVVAKVQGEKDIVISKYKRRSTLWLFLWFCAMGGWTIDHVRLTNHVVEVQNIAATAQTNAESLVKEVEKSQRQSHELLDQISEWKRVAKEALAVAEGKR